MHDLLLAESKVKKNGLLFGNKFYTTDDMCCGVYFFWEGFHIEYVTPVILIPIIIPQCLHGKYYIELNTSRSFLFHMLYCRHYLSICFFHFFLGKWVGITTAPVFARIEISYLLYEKWQCPLGWWILTEVRESLH